MKKLRKAYRALKLTKVELRPSKIVLDIASCLSFIMCGIAALYILGSIGALEASKISCTKAVSKMVIGSVWFALSMLLYNGLSITAECYGLTECSSDDSTEMEHNE